MSAIWHVKKGFVETGSINIRTCDCNSAPTPSVSYLVMVQIGIATANRQKQKVVVHHLNLLSHTQNTCVCFPWRSHKCCPSQNLSGQHKKELKEGQEKKKQDWHDMLHDAHEMIWGLPRHMEATFGSHEAKY